MFGERARRCWGLCRSDVPPNIGRGSIVFSVGLYVGGVGPFSPPPPRHGLVETAPESNSACVDLRLECAGWAACVVGPGVAGQVFVIAQPSETMMQILPTEEQAAKVDFTNYSSPDADYPMMGVIAALTVKALGEAMFCNVMRKEHILGLAPLKPIDIPPLKTYSYIATTDEALCLL